MTKWLLGMAWLVVWTTPAMARLECPAADRPLAERDLYVDKHLAVIGAQPDPDAKAIEQVTLAECIIKWCTPMYERHRTVARTALLQARQNLLTNKKAKRLEKAMKACKSGATAPIVQQPPPGSPSVWKSVTGWTLIGLGVVAGGLGYFFHLEESDARDDHSAALAANESADTINGFREEIDDWQTRKGLTWFAGGVLAAAGIGLVVWDALDDDDTVKAWIGPGTVGIGGRF